MFDCQPIASATPDGQVHIDRKHRWIPDDTLKYVEGVESSYREQLARTTSRDGIYKTNSQPQTSPRTIGFRKDATLRDDILRRDNRGDGSRRRASNGRR